MKAVRAVRTLGIAGAVLLQAAMVSAEEAVWVNSSDASANWWTTSNWKGPGGEPLAEPPTNVADSVVFGPLATDGAAQTITWEIPGSSQSRYELGLASIADDDPYSRRFINFDIRYYYSCWDIGAWLTLEDPSGFNGYLSANGSSFGIRLPATADKPLSVANVSSARRVDIDVPTAGTKATVGTVYGGGTLVKTGAGELEVEVASGPGSVIHVSGGTLTVGGSAPDAADDDDCPVPDAWMHLDANRLDTMAGFVGDDGRTYVTNWCDVRGREKGLYAWFDASWMRSETATHLIPESHPPFLNATCLDGKTVVDFGRCSGSQDESWGPVACWMKLSERREIVREVFLVTRRHGANGNVVGDYNDRLESQAFYPDLPRIARQGMYNSGSVRSGDIMLNGVRVDADAAVFNSDRFDVVSVGTTNPVLVCALGTGRLYDGHTGGWQLAEIILFTNVLTHVDRARVQQYLMRKWTADDASADRAVLADAVTLASDDVSLGVPSGRAAFVPEVTAVGGTLVKTGGGELTVGALSSLAPDRAAAVEVRDGSVKFGGLAAVPDDTPAAEPWLWLKAERATMSLSSRDGRDYVSRWNDCRSGQTSRYAELPVGESGYKAGVDPFVLDNAVGELGAVDFGKRDDAYLRIVGRGRSVYDAFVVQAVTDDRAVPVFGNWSENNAACDLYPGSDNRFLDDQLGHHTGRNAVWTFNGVVVDPLQKGTAKYRNGEWNVMSVSAFDLLNIGTLGNNERGTTWGACRIGEVIYYDRRLSAAERRQTVAYLMKKWRNTSLFGAGTARVSRLSFGPTATAVIDNGMAIDADAVEVSGGSLVKRGDGAFTMSGTLADAGVSSLAVEGGRLAVGSNPLAGMLRKSALHFDATDLSKIDYFVSEDEDGTVRTNIVQVADRLPGGTPMKAKLFSGDTPCQTNPTLRVVETATGVSMPVFDFGPQYTSGKAEKAGSLVMDAPCATVREAHVIYADTVDTIGQRAHWMDIFSSDDYSLDYYRGNDACLIRGGSSSVDVALAGDMGLDGVRMTGSAAANRALPLGFHLVSAFPAPCEADPSGNATIGSMGAAHKSIKGGCQVGELIAFSEPLPEAESRFLQDCLMAKWLGGTVPSWTNTLETLTVAAESALALGESDVLSVSLLGGSGTVEVGVLRTDGSLALTAGRPLTVSGRFEQTGPLAVSVATDEKPAPGEYPVLMADSFENLDLSTWTLSVDLGRMRTAKLVRKGNAVYLAIEKTGLCVIVK